MSLANATGLECIGPSHHTTPTLTPLGIARVQKCRDIQNMLTWRIRKTSQFWSFRKILWNDVKWKISSDTVVSTISFSTHPLFMVSTGICVFHPPPFVCAPTCSPPYMSEKCDFPSVKIISAASRPQWQRALLQPDHITHTKYYSSGASEAFGEEDGLGPHS